MLSELREPLLAYLNGPGFARLWPKVKEKLEKLNRIGGRVTLTGLSPNELKSIEGLLAINLHGQDSCVIDLKHLNSALIQSRFETTLDECMHLLYPGTFVSRKEERESEQLRWADFCQWALSLAMHETLKNWVESLSSQSSTTIGYRTFRECYDEYREFGDSVSWRHASAAMHLLLGRNSGSAVRLPIFAAAATGDPHGLDRDRLAGRMFFRGLVVLSQPDQHDQLDSENDDWRTLEASDGEAIRALYHRFGILLDDISSFVFVANFPGVAELPIALPLLHVDQLSIGESPGPVFVVENPSIFGTLADTVTFSETVAVLGEDQSGVPSHGEPAAATSDRKPARVFSDRKPAGVKSALRPLICTSGQPSIAALHLLDKVTTAGGSIYYNGDFDVAGMQMAVSLAERYGESFVPWRMQARDYVGVQHDSLPKLSDMELARLQEMVVPWEDGRPTEDGLLKAMAVRGVKVFQEHIMEQLREDYVSYALRQ